MPCFPARRLVSRLTWLLLYPKGAPGGPAPGGEGIFLLLEPPG